MDRVRIGTCSGPAEAALVRAAFEAHGIPIVINAEQHASMLGGLGGAFVPLHIFVREDRAEEAAALLEDLRAHAGEAPADEDGDDDDGREADGGEGGADDADDADDAEEDAAAGEAAPIEVRIARRRCTVAVLLVGFCVTFGTAHMLTGAWLRGLVLAVIEASAIVSRIEGGRGLSMFLIFACIAIDVIGALWRVHAGEPGRARKAELPIARVRR
jgi:hypothetical protein